MTSTPQTTPAEPAPPSAARPGSRLQRARMPIAKDVVEAVAISHGVCIRPVTMKATNDTTGEVTFVDVPCGATLDSKCPPCAERARRLRVHQCREGWHLDTEPDLTPDEPNQAQRELATARADITAAREEFKAAGDELSAHASTEAANSVDIELSKAGVREDIDPPAKTRRARSTAVARTPPTYPNERWPRPRSGAPSPARTAPSSGRPCS